MFSFFKKAIKPLPDHLPYSVDDGMTIIDTYKMSFDERKAWRLEMMCKAVSEVFLGLDITNSMYRFRAVATDDRGHYYAVLVEPTAHFSLSNYASPDRLILIENLLKLKTFENFGLVVDGVFWRATDNVDVLKHQYKSRSELLAAKPKKTIHDLTHDFRDTIPADSKFGAVTKEEVEAFRAAIANGGKRPPFSVGGKQYDTDLAPLNPE